MKKETIVEIRFAKPLRLWFYRHPVLAERACLALCRRSEPLSGHWPDWTLEERSDWRAFKRNGYKGELKRVMIQTRRPPMPFRDVSLAANRCPVCGQPVFRGGDWREIAGPPRTNTRWHVPCVIANDIWMCRIGDRLRLWMARRQGWRCPEQACLLKLDAHGMPLGDIEHREPLWRVRYFADRYSWPDVLHFWSTENLQLMSWAGHAAKTAREARERRALYSDAPLRNGALSLLGDQP